MRIVLGNRDAVHTVKKPGDDGELVETVEKLKGKRATEIDIPDGTDLVSALTTITHGSRGVWASHAAEGATPAWIAGDNEALVGFLAAHFGGIEIRELDVNPPTKPARGRGAAAAATTMTAVLLAVLLLTFLRLNPFLKTNAGNDFQAKQMAGAASATAVAKWMAITANTTAPAGSDTALTGEITTGGGGLIRAAGTYAHTTGAASYTITNTFTANGSDSLPVTIGKMGIFDAAAAGNMPFTTLVSPTAVISASGDALTLTQTVTL